MIPYGVLFGPSTFVMVDSRTKLSTCRAFCGQVCSDFPSVFPSRCRVPSWKVTSSDDPLTQFPLLGSAKLSSKTTPPGGTGVRVGVAVGRGLGVAVGAAVG